MADEPAEFYKYRSLADSGQVGFVEDILLNNRLYWPSPRQFNDPFDCAPIAVPPDSMPDRIRYARGLVERAGGHLSKHEKARVIGHVVKTKLAEIETNAPNIVHDRLAEIGVCSFSELSDDILMWSHYADAHRGVCLQFRPTRFDWSHFLPFPVEYSMDRPVLRLETRDMQEWARVSLLTKARHWNYEKEWRAIDVNGSGYHAFRPGILDAVILGAKISSEHRDLITAWATKRSRLMKIRQARFDEREFKIVVGDV